MSEMDTLDANDRTPAPCYYSPTILTALQFKCYALPCGLTLHVTPRHAKFGDKRLSALSHDPKKITRHGRSAILSLIFPSYDSFTLKNWGDSK